MVLTIQIQDRTKLSTLPCHCNVRRSVALNTLFPYLTKEIASLSPLSDSINSSMSLTARTDLFISGIDTFSNIIFFFIRHRIDIRFCDIGKQGICILFFP